MRRPTSLVLITAGILAGSNIAQGASNLGNGARVTAGAESAMVRQNRLIDYKPLSGSHVPTGAELRCDKPCTLQVDPDNTLFLSAGAVVSVGAYFYVPLVANAPSLTPAHQIELREGVIEAVSPTPESLPLVISPGPEEHVALRDGRAQISQKGEHTAVATLRGNVRVGGSHSWVTLDKGQAASVRSHGRPSTPRPMLAAPKWTASEGSCPGAVSMTVPDGHAVVGACWEHSGAATRYEVELASDAEFHQTLSRDAITNDSWGGPLGVGRYFVRVRGVDADGLYGELSPPRQLAVVPCLLSPGATLDADARSLVVPQGREVSFGDAAGLEMAIDRAGFSRAPKSMVMDDGPEHTLRFRLKDDPTSISAAYVARRRALVADVRITPKKAFWPADPVDVAVTMQDASGQIDPVKVEPRLQVLLGTTQLSVQWTHRDAVWSAHIDPRPTGGPTVLRVIASDEFGTPLGRNFLEIEEKQGSASAPSDGRRVAHN